jgi:hypothetical protein
MTFDRTSAPRRKEWLGLHPRRLRWAEPQPRYLKHNNQTAERSLVIMRQKICRYYSCWLWRWRQRWQRCEAIGGKPSLEGGSAANVIGRSAER